MEFEICPCCGKPKRPKGINHPSSTCAAAALDRQSGVISPSYRNGDRAMKGNNKVYGKYPNRDDGLSIKNAGYNDSGGASRFFYQVQHQLDEADPVRYCAKSSRRERDAGLEGMPLKELATISNGGVSGKIQTVGRASLENRKTNPESCHNPHPTIKPLDLCKYLSTLLLPPPAYAPRRILVPFAGVMSEAIGARLAGWEHVTAIEAEAEYCDIGRARVEHWTKAIQLELINGH